jgi:hypothetical protein
VNRARAKTWSREVPANADLFRLYSDYLHEEYRLLNCDYVFVNPGVLPLGLRCPTPASTGWCVGCGTAPGSCPGRTCLGTAATGLLRRGVAAEIVQHLLWTREATAALRALPVVSAAVDSLSVER